MEVVVGPSHDERVAQSFHEGDRFERENWVRRGHGDVFVLATIAAAV